MNLSRALAGLVIGVVFGVGLAVSGMTNPEKVLGFLDLVDGWDPSLIFVMGGAVAVTAVGYRWAGHSTPILDAEHHLPVATFVDARLLAGAAVFGLGWGLAGYCPGPALAGLLSGSWEPPAFIAAMFAGSQLARLLFD